MKVIPEFTVSHGKYKLYVETTPTFLENKSVRYFKLYRTDVIVPFEVGSIVQTTTNKGSSFKGTLFQDSEQEVLQLAMYFLENEWQE